MALHGRDDELRAIDAVLATAADGEFHALALVGEAGIGKSALMEAAAARAEERELRVIAGRAAEHERTVPFGLVVDALDDVAAGIAAPRLAAAGAELGAVLPSVAQAGAAADAAGPGERFRYHRALRAFVELLGRERPVALLLDDLQWADEASLEWVLHLLRRLPRAPGALIAAARPGAAATRLLEAVGGAGDHLVVGPLPHAAAIAALADADGVADRALQERIAAEAGGNPLFLRELARAARRSDGGLPQTIAAAVRQDVERLPPEARTLLEGAAVAGDPFDPELAAAAAGVDHADALAGLDRLVAADLVRATDAAAFEFRHPLVRRAVYDGVPPGWRLAAHERAARLLTERGAAPSRRAYHVERFARMGDDDAIALLADAAAQDVGSSPATAARWYAAALRLLPDDAADRRAALLVPYGDALAASGRLAQAIDAFDEALVTGTLAATEDVIVSAARTERLLGRYVAARGRLLAAIESADDSNRDALEFELAAVEFTLGNKQGMIEHARNSVRGTADDDPAGLAVADAVEGFVQLWSGTPDRELVARAERRSLELLSDAHFDPATWVAQLSFAYERFGPATEQFERAIDGARRLRRDDVLPGLRTTQALALWFDLQPLRALEAAEAAEDGARLQDSVLATGFAVNVRACVLDLLGRPADAVAAATESQTAFDRCERSIYTSIGALLNYAVIYGRDPERLIAESLPLLGDELQMLGRPTTFLRPLIAAALATGRRADAEEWMRRVDHHLGDPPLLPAAAVRVAIARAELLLDGDDPERAAAVARAAVELADAEVVRLDAARARVTLGRALAATGDRDGGVAEFERVIVDAGRAEAGQLTAEAARELRRAGARVPASVRRATAAGDDLSERERSIAELVAEGRSNKEVAAALFLSGKTVENNLSRIYAKLGVRSRTELARTLRDP